MGGIADYSGSLVLQWPIRESTRVALEFQPAPLVRVVSRDPIAGTRHVDVPLALVNTARPPYTELRAWFADDSLRHWAAYVAGVFAVLAGEHRVTYPQGAVVTVDSDVPEGKGVSSSAALEAATMTALVAALDAEHPTHLKHLEHPKHPKHLEHPKHLKHPVAPCSTL